MTWSWGWQIAQWRASVMASPSRCSHTIQDILAEPQWADVLGDADRRGLTPLFTSNMTPYGDIQLDTTRRLALGGPS